MMKMSELKMNAESLFGTLKNSLNWSDAVTYTEGYDNSILRMEIKFPHLKDSKITVIAYIMSGDDLNVNLASNLALNPALTPVRRVRSPQAHTEQ